jgi:ketosteroid isomerase-like protein
VSDYQRIQLLVYSYAERIDAGDFEAVAALMSKARLLFLPSAEVLEGGAQVLSANRMRVKIYPHTGTPCTTHYVNNLVIELEGDRATAQSLFTVTQALEGFPLQTIMAGRYYDKFVKERDLWRFSKRTIAPEYFGDLSFHLNYFEKPQNNNMHNTKITRKVQL